MPPSVEVIKEAMSEEEKEKKVKSDKAKKNKSSKEKIISEFEAMNLQARREVLRKFFVPKESLIRKTANSELGSAYKMVALNETDYDDLESDAEDNFVKLKKQKCP
ncbi:hypothetical protein BpHYR1_043471 [Brachionus plicatilis]|uniref:Uncharacterized protein n=1 Tax=Brachionus plicatilis TaxID=10195 RepID=A0A3M7QKK4_BRAPC|nr:hypothetical protein BpHYR1_043471 [Brachionus plicatilis]